jgi:hypothetical protein
VTATGDLRQFEPPVVAGGSGPGATGGLDSPAGQVDLLPGQRASFVQPDQQEEFVDQLAHPA